jgi:hypothetical protein
MSPRTDQSRHKVVWAPCGLGSGGRGHHEIISLRRHEAPEVAFGRGGLLVGFCNVKRHIFLLKLDWWWEELSRRTRAGTRRGQPSVA